MEVEQKFLADVVFCFPCEGSRIIREYCWHS